MPLGIDVMWTGFAVAVIGWAVAGTLMIRLSWLCFARRIPDEVIMAGPSYRIWRIAMAVFILGTGIVFIGIGMDLFRPL